MTDHPDAGADAGDHALPSTVRRPAGVREAGQPGAPLGWVDPGGLALDVGGRVVVRDGERAWLAEVAVSADRIVEAPALPALPVVDREADVSEWPASAPRAGLALLRSLDRPD